MIDHRARCVAYRHHRLSGVRTSIEEDIRRYATFSPAYQPELTATTRLSVLLQPSLLCLCWSRVSHYFYLRRWTLLAHLVSRLNLIVHKANIPPQSCIGPGCFVGHCPGLTFHGTAGRNLTLLSLAICCPHEQGFGGRVEEGPCLGDRVLVGAHAVVIGPISVGDDARVATNTCLNVECPPKSVAYCSKLRHSTGPRDLIAPSYNSNER
jgi:serine O-acetyltransferase